MSNEKIKAYEGNKPYAFVSYSHKDGKKVYPIISKLNSEGYHIWYDEEMPTICNYGKVLYDKIKSCDKFIFFISPDSVASEDVIREVENAYKLKKPTLLVELGKTELPSDLSYLIKPMENRLTTSLSEDELYKKLREALAECREGDVSVGDIIKFGVYPQGMDGEKWPLNWRVLAVENGRMLIITEKCIDCLPYHNICKKVTWKDCTLNKWMNTDFINVAFDKNNQKKLIEVTNSNEKTKGKSGKNSKERVFALSSEEAKKYFSSDESRIADSTGFARKGHDDPKRRCWCYNKTFQTGWWLRSPGENADDAAYVRYDGRLGDSDPSNLNNNYFSVIKDNVGVRPACWVTL